MSRSVLRLFVLAATLGTSSLAFAQAAPTADWALNGAPQAATLHSSHVLQNLAYGNSRSALRSSTSGGSKATRPAAKPVPLTFDAGRPIAPSKLASSYPASHRSQAEQVFAQTLDGYRKIEAQFGLRRNDLGGALAAFVAGNYIAYRNEPFPDRLFPPLVQQMQVVLQSSGTLENTSLGEKQELYENLAILGTYMALMREAVHKSPNDKLAATMKTTARGYLEQALKLDPDRMRLTEQGLVVN